MRGTAKIASKVEARDQVISEEDIETGPPSAERRSQAVNRASLRTRILNASVALFGERGFDGTTTRAIAQSAGITHSLLLYYFSSKEDVWAATLEDALNNFMQEICDNLSNADARPTQEVLSVYIQQLVRVCARSPYLYRVLSLETNNNAARMQRARDVYLQKLFDAVCDLIRAGQREGSVRPADPARLFYLIMSAAGAPFNGASGYRQFTGRDIQSKMELRETTAFVLDLVFI